MMLLILLIIFFFPSYSDAAVFTHTPEVIQFTLSVDVDSYDSDICFIDSPTADEIVLGWFDNTETFTVVDSVGLPLVSTSTLSINLDGSQTNLTAVFVECSDSGSTIHGLLRYNAYTEVQDVYIDQYFNYPFNYITLPEATSTATTTLTIIEEPANTLFNGFVIFLMFASWIIWIFRPKSN